MVRDVKSQRKVRIKNPKDTLKLRLVFDKYSVEIFVNDGEQGTDTGNLLMDEKIRK